MRKLFRSSKTPSATEGEKVENKDTKKEKKKKPLSISSKSASNIQYPYLSNIPQLARASDAEALATALAAEVVADNVDAGIPVLLKTAPTQVDLSKAPENLRRGSVLKQAGRLSSVSSETSVEPHSPTSVQPPANSLLASPPLSPSSPSYQRSNSTASRTSRPRVHFDVSEKIILDAQWYSHQQRFTISSGNFLHFERPPTTNYRFSTTTESINTKGTLLQLITSASSDDEKNTWDSITALPLYAARFYNPNVTSADRTIYWEADIRSIGFSKFSSLDHTDNNSAGRNAASPGKTPNSPPTSPRFQTIPATEDDLAEVGLSRSMSHTNQISNRMTGSAIAIGFVVKSVTPDTVAFLRRRSSLRPVDEFPFPSSTAGDGIFWSSDHGGSVYIAGQQTRHTVKAGVGDTIGIGITFKYDSPNSKENSSHTTPVPTPPTTPPPTLTPQKDLKEGAKRKSSAPSFKDPSEVPCADPRELQAVAVEVFFVVNGEKKLSFFHPDLGTNPFDLPIPDYMLGQFDVFPSICVQGAGVECKTRIGPAVTWHGAGGSPEKKPVPVDEQNGAKDASKENSKKSGRWWSHLSH